MIPKAQILQLSKYLELLPTIVEKDYVIGWLLRAISQHPNLSKWIFKGGTCLKKCYFETYRFSEDLDFTIPKEIKLDQDLIKNQLTEIIEWIEANSGLEFPRPKWKIEEYANPRGNISYQVKIPFSGPLQSPKNSLQKVKFDLTQDEIISNKPVLRPIHHDYIDKLDTQPQVHCYSIEEILAEKTRALLERNGRARDVFDVVNMDRTYKDNINPKIVKSIAIEKFNYKELPPPSVDQILNAIDEDTLKINWENQLAHQINKLPKVETYINELRDSIAWWLEPESILSTLSPMKEAVGTIIPRVLFPEINPEEGLTPMDQIRYASRNRLCAIVHYHRSERLVEPYSLRHPSTGNILLHVWELEKNGRSSNKHKSFKINEITSASVSDNSFSARWIVEL